MATKKTTKVKKTTASTKPEKVKVSKPRTKKVKDKGAPAPKMVDFSFDGHSVTKNEMKFYVDAVQKMHEVCPPADAAIVNRSDADIEAEERAILGDEYDKTMLADPSPEVHNAAQSIVANITAATNTAISAVPDFGILSEVASALGIPTRSFNKLMEILISERVVSPGAIVNYNNGVKEFISRRREEKRKAEAARVEAEIAAAQASKEKEIKTITDTLKWRIEKATKEGDLDTLKDLLEATGTDAMEMLKTEDGTDGGSCQSHLGNE